MNPWAVPHDVGLSAGPQAVMAPADVSRRVAWQTPGVDRLLDLLTDAAAGRFPAPDLGVEVLPSPAGRSDAVVAFSGHNVVAADVDPDEVRGRLPDRDPGGPMSPAFLVWLAAQTGATAGSLDVVLVADGLGGAPELSPRDDADAHDRVTRAQRYRADVRVHADAERSGVVILGRGLAGRREVSIELDPERRGRGLGTDLARRARTLVPYGELLFAQVAPGNVASLRAFLRAGYRPICAEVLFLRP
jgi:GNAT superfamily N-acetyltransferase